MPVSRAASPGLVLALVLSLISWLVPIAGARDDGLQREAQRRGLLFLDAIAADDARRREIIPDIFAPSEIERIGIERLVALFGRLKSQYAPLTSPVIEVTTTGVGPSARAVLHVFAKDGTGQWRDFQIRQQARSPYALTELAFTAIVTEPIALPNGAITSPETIAWLRGYAGRLFAEHELSCSILITGPEGDLLEMQTGFADAGQTVRNTPETRFAIASIGKLLTAVAVGRLVDQGALSFDDPISKFLPDFADPEFSAACTIRHLLSHTSGVPEYWTTEYVAEKPQFRSIAEYIPFIERRPIQFQPGAQFQYSNSNYILLGLIIQRATGRDYFEFVRREVIEPLGMTGTSFIRDPACTAEALEGEKGNWRPVEPAPRPEGVLHCSSAGGAFSTPRDLTILARAIWKSELLRPETTRQMLASAVPAGDDPSDWGLGVERHVQGGVASFGHGGTASGCQGVVRVFPEEGVIVVILANQNVPAFDDLRRNTIRLITGER